MNPLLARAPSNHCLPSWLLFPPPPPPPYSGPPPPYSQSLPAARSHTPPDEVGPSTRSVLQALPTRDIDITSCTASSSTPSFNAELTSPALDEIEKGQDDFLRSVEKEWASVASLRQEVPATESSTTGVGCHHGALNYDTRIASREDLSSPSIGTFRAVCSTDLLFLIDTTTSMQGYIDAAKAQVKRILNSVNDAFFGQAEVRTAIVGYKDHSDYPNVEFLDFTSSVEQVRTFLTRLRASGGSDVPEDVLGGLHQALNATWSHQTRCIIHIADAPPHGTSLQNTPIDGDSYPCPGKEPHGLTHEPLLSRLIDLNVNYGLLRINNSTDRMAYIFSEAYNAASGDGKLLESNQHFSLSSRVTTTDGRAVTDRQSSAAGNGLLFEEFELGTAYGALQHLVVKVVTASASRNSMRAPIKRRLGKANAAAFMPAINEEEETVDVPVEEVTPQWNVQGWLDETLEMEGFSPDMRMYSASTLDDMIGSDENIKMSLTQLTIRKRSRPFAQGSMRTASYAGTASSTNHFVAKTFKKRGKTFDHVVEDMRGQALCKAFALEFNALIDSSTQIDFIVSICLKDEGKTDVGSDDHCMSLEPHVPGEYVKYNNNRGWVNEDDKGQFNQLAQAFSHFSFERSEGQLMITDLQGVGRTLTDPSIHTRDPNRFSLNNTNYGEDGFMFFFQTHKCNAICQQLGLESKGIMFKSNKWKFKLTWPKLVSTVCCSNKLCGVIIQSDGARKISQFPGFSWCHACWLQLKASKVSCVVEGHVHKKTNAFFLESQGQKVPQACGRHRGSSSSRLELDMGEILNRNVILHKDFWNKLTSARRKVPIEDPQKD